MSASMKGDKPRLSPLLATTFFVASAMAFTASAATTIKIGSPAINDSVHHWMNEFKGAVEASSKGTFQVEIYPASQLGSIPRMIEGTQIGSIEMVSMPADFLVGLDKRFSVISAPGLFENAEQAFKTLHDPAFKDQYWRLGDAKGVRMIGVACDAFATYAFVPEIKSIDDFKGRKIRVFGSRTEVETLRRLGASPTPMPLNEVQPGLQQRVIDATKSGPHVLVAQKLYDIAKYLVRTNESIICSPRLVSRVWFDRLPVEQQQLIRDAAKTADEANQPFNIQFEKDAYAAWEKAGGTLIEFAPDVREKLLRDLATAAEVAEKDDAEFQKMLKLVRQVSERHR